MGQGSYCICEWDSVNKENSMFQQTMRRLDETAINKCNMDWKPRSFNSARALTGNGGFYGRTTIMPALFDDHSGYPLDIVGGAASATALAFTQNPIATYRQRFATASVTATDTVLLQGVGTGETIPEDFKVAWAGLAFPNKNQHITEIKYQIGDRKYGRINIEEMLCYNKPAIIFEEGYVLDEEESFHLYGYVEGPVPRFHDGWTGIYQRIVPLGAAYYKVVSKVLGQPGTPISAT
jgi:hypothetical protein